MARKIKPMKPKVVKLKDLKLKVKPIKPKERKRTGSSIRG